MAIKRYIKRGFMAGALAVGSVVAVAQAEDLQLSGYENAKPLVVVRFNEPAVSYEETLEKTVQKALKIRPNAYFHVVAVVPQSEDKKRQESLSTAGAQRRAKFIGDLVKDGVAPMRIQGFERVVAGITDVQMYLFAK